MRIALSPERRRGVAGLIVAVVIFALIFTAGFGYLIFQDKVNLNSYQANAAYQAGKSASSLEGLAFAATSTGGALTITVNDTGAFPLSVMSSFITDSTGKVSSSGVMQLGGSCIAGGPLNLDVGGAGSFSISSACYSYVVGTTIFISLTTSRGNTFTTQFPISSTTVISTITSTTSITTTAPGVGGGNALVVVMAATPVQVFGGNIITDNVTVFNYSNVPMTGVTLNPATPTYSITGTAAVTPQSCAGPYTPPHSQADPTGTISAYGGSGQAPHIFFLCTYKASTGAVGGLVSFFGGAEGTESGTNIVSSSVTSNLVQIGSLTNALSEGVFSSNFFFFKYTSCTSSHCSGTNPSSIPPGSVYGLPEGNVISSGSNYYVAFYVQLTNNFNTTLPILSTTFEQLDQSNGGESDWWVVGTNSSSFRTNGAYYPSYTGTPSLTAYPTDCATVNGNNKPTDANCIYINPGQTVVLTLASCGPGSSTWDWGSSTSNGGGSCVSSSPAFGSGGSATAANTVVCFEYKGQTFTEDLAFQGVAVTS